MRRSSIEKWTKFAIKPYEKNAPYAPTVGCRNRTKEPFISMAAQDMTLNTVTCV